MFEMTNFDFPILHLQKQRSIRYLVADINTVPKHFHSWNYQRGDVNYKCLDDHTVEFFSSNIRMQIDIGMT